MKLTFAVKNRSAVVANLRAADARLQAAVRREVKTSGEFTKELTQFLSPVRTGFMRDHVRTEYSADGLVYETGWDAEDFPKALYPVFVELGTRFMAAQPSLGPAHAYASEIFKRNLAAALKRAASRAN